MKPIRLYLLRGLPGSGKSTLARDLCAAGLAHKHYEADDYFIRPNGAYVWTPKELPAAHEACRLKTMTALKAGFNVVVANTFVQLWTLQPYLNMNVPTRVITCEGSFPNVHGVTNEAIEEMRNKWENYN